MIDDHRMNLRICQKARKYDGVWELYKVEATKLEPGQSVSSTVNALALKGPEWPQGGYRIEFRFCLGEKSKTQSFYYMSRHHDKLRDAAQKANAAPAEGK